MIDPDQLRTEIIRPALQYLEPYIPYSLAAENLLMGTCAQESALGQYLCQLNCGPAKGIFQMEPATHADIWLNYLTYKDDLAQRIETMSCQALSDDQLLIGNMFYAAVMARVHYYRVKEALPAADDIQALAEYWKKFYNTPSGAGTVHEFIENYHRYIVPQG